MFSSYIHFHCNTHRMNLLREVKANIMYEEQYYENCIPDLTTVPPSSPNSIVRICFAFFQEFYLNRHIVEVGHDKAGLIKAVKNHIDGHGMFTEHYIVCCLSRCCRFSNSRAVFVFYKSYLIFFGFKFGANKNPYFVAKTSGLTLCLFITHGLVVVANQLYDVIF